MVRRTDGLVWRGLYTYIRWRCLDDKIDTSTAFVLYVPLFFEGVGNTRPRMIISYRRLSDPTRRERGQRSDGAVAATGCGHGGVVIVG